MRINNNGITLIYLIITIIIMLILTAVVMGYISENQIIEKVKISKNKYEDAKGNESNVLNSYTEKLEILQANDSKELPGDIDEIIAKNPMGSNQLDIKDNVQGNIDLSVKANYTINLNGNTLYTNQIKNSHGNIFIKNGNIKPLKDSPIYLSGATTASGCKVNASVQCAGSITLTNDTVINGTVENSGNNTLMLYGVTIKEGLKIKGGSVNTYNHINNIYSNDIAVTIISGGFNVSNNTSIEGKEYGIKVKSGVLNISGGKVVSNNFDAINIENYPTVKITGGIITGGKEGYGIYRKHASSLEITGGTITGGKGIKNF